MTIWILLAIIFGIASGVLIPICVKYWEETGVFLVCLVVICAIIFVIMAITQPLLINQLSVKLEKERQQIEYQIANLDESKDKIKLNEWILTYNDTVNYINTSKEVYGWFSLFAHFDMTNHTIIDLV